MGRRLASPLEDERYVGAAAAPLPPALAPALGKERFPPPRERLEDACGTPDASWAANPSCSGVFVPCPVTLLLLSPRPRGHPSVPGVPGLASLFALLSAGMPAVPGALGHGDRPQGGGR